MNGYLLLSRSLSAIPNKLVPPNDTAPFFSASDNAFSTIHLDLVPGSCLDEVVLALKKVIKPGTSAAIVFSTMAACNSSALILAAISFMARKHSHQNGSQTLYSRLTRAPLYPSLNPILKALTSETTFIIESVQNVSLAYIEELDGYVQRLQTNAEMNMRVVSDRGVRGLREECVLRTWESALHRGGLVTRWSVAVRAK
ncbi:hypothetical protein K474DRAFT_1664455 [Panus rudis PR-1116 ss-1]|nr:hypothetical protein K474DRAFT_1664455 [Panus rudis PR-1116 ss-1]